MMDGPAKALAENADVKEFCLGLSSEGRKSFRDMQPYRRSVPSAACCST